MVKQTISKAEGKKLKLLVDHFEANRKSFELILNQLVGYVQASKSLTPYIHSLKWRVKDADHLKDKLIRNLKRAKEEGRNFDITTDNLFSKINDLAGFRILHLYTRQIEPINKALKDLLAEAQFPIIEGPRARSWDDESRAYFKQIGIKSENSPTMYTSVHYVIEANTRTKYTCEIQVRTLMEEVWGEVDHRINYPYATDSLHCLEQIKVLARVTSGCTRLVDSIFRSHEQDGKQTTGGK